MSTLTPEPTCDCGGYEWYGEGAHSLACAVMKWRDAKVTENDDVILAYERETGVLASEVSPQQRRAFRAGMRYQHERTREAAAKVCDGQHWLRAFANAIRALTLDEC